MKKFALVLSGGGFKGAFQVGALEYLKENWKKIDPDNNEMKYKIIAGVSVGALNGLLVASDKFDALKELWKDVADNGVEDIYTSYFIDTTHDKNNPNPQLKMNNIWDAAKKQFPNSTSYLFLRYIFCRRALLSDFEQELKNFKSIADNTPLKDKLVDLAKQKDIQDCIYKCGYVSLNNGKYYSSKHSDFDNDIDFANGVLASTVMPIIWSPVEIQKESKIPEYCVDGGLRNVSPLGDVIGEIRNDTSPEEYLIIIINCSSGEVEQENYKNKNIAQIALRSLADITITEIFNNDLREFADKNYILEQIKDALPQKDIHDYDFKKKAEGKILKHFNSIIIQPDVGVLKDSLIANNILIESRIQHGRQKAEQALDQFLKQKQIYFY